MRTWLSLEGLGRVTLKTISEHICEIIRSNFSYIYITVQLLDWVIVIVLSSACGGN
jgi:hypothetical protein